MKSRGGVVCGFATFATGEPFAALPAVPVLPAFSAFFGADACFVLDAAFVRLDFAADLRAGVVVRRVAGVDAFGLDALGFDAPGFDGFGFEVLAFDALGLDRFGFDALGFDAFAPRRGDAAGFPRPDFFRAAGGFFRGADFFTAFLTLGTPRLRLVTDVARVRHFFGIKSTNGATNVNSN